VSDWGRRVNIPPAGTQANSRYSPGNCTFVTDLGLSNFFILKFQGTWQTNYIFCELFGNGQRFIILLPHIYQDFPRVFAQNRPIFDSFCTNRRKSDTSMREIIAVP